MAKSDETDYYPCPLCDSQGNIYDQITGECEPGICEFCGEADPAIVEIIKRQRDD